MNRAIYLALIAAVSPVALATAAAQDLPRTFKPEFVAIFDLRQSDPDAEAIAESSAAVSFPSSEISQTPVACGTLTDSVRPVARGELLGFIECALNAELTLEKRARAAANIAASLPVLRKHHSARALSRRGSEILVVVIQNARMRSVIRTCGNRADLPVAVSVAGRHPKIRITETKRDTRIASDFGTLLELAAEVAAPMRGAAGGAVRSCRYAFKTTPINWASPKPVALAQKRATVDLKAMLPAVAPAVLAKSDDPAVAELVKAAEDNLAKDALAEQEKAEKEILDLFKTCPLAGAARFDPAAQAGCGLRAGDLSEQLAAVDALSQMTTSARLAVLRWAVENRPGSVREGALVALAVATPPPSAPAAPKIPDAVEQELKLVSGPREHWSLSADMFVSRNTTFKGTDGKLGVEGVPPIFYVSANFLLGDVLRTDQRTWWETIELKWLFEGSKTPLESMGVGLGLGKLLSHFGLNFDAISPFVGVTWTKSETAGEPRDRKTRLGVSLDLKKALDWVK